MSEHTKTPWSVELGEEIYICSEETQCDVTTVVNFDRTKENEANARHIVHCVNNHERLVEALWHAMQCWEYDGVSDEHGAVAMHCSELLAALEAEKGGEL